MVEWQAKGIIVKTERMPCLREKHKTVRCCLDYTHEALWCEKGYPLTLRREGGREGVSLLEGKTQNSEVLMLGLHSLLEYVQKGTWGGREGEQFPCTSCGFSTGPSSKNNVHTPIKHFGFSPRIQICNAACKNPAVRPTYVGVIMRADMPPTSRGGLLN